ncbi:ricin-type beta-trefoil lectin domain protein [Kitasatospora purpeofusca]|uniref:ricin-type beta-trefoil lectin domain protein n=1 Tax=Kitasatospora purpeofusca TaxID=67352 RepID=UPI0036AAEBAE
MRRLVPACALGLVLGAAPTVALADDRPFAAPSGKAGVEAPAFPGPAAGPLQAARLKAKSTGKPVTVDELTTETSTTVARPDGKLDLISSLLPVRVKKGGGWADVDTALVRNGDGSFSPKATPSGVKVSGGGTGPLATLTDREGRSLALTFPVALPRPTVTGGTALYAEVLKGVDLLVEVGDQGGVREVLVVKNAEAAANPALKSLRFGTSSPDLVVSGDEHGAVTAATADGKVAFKAPAPIMWDSATDAPAAPAPVDAPAPTPTSVDAPASKSAPAGRSAAAAAAEPQAAAPAGAPEPPAGSPSSTDAPGRGAHVKPIGVDAGASALTLTPDADLLTGKGTVWPLYIDPAFQPTSPMGTNHYAQVMEGTGCANVPKYDVPQENGEGIGFQHYQANCYGLHRSYFELNTSAVTPQMYIDQANMYFNESYAAAHNCNADAPVTLKWTGAINSGTSWINQPAVVEEIGTQWPKSAYFGCGQKEVIFNVTGQLRSVAQQGITAWTVGLFGDETKSTGNDHFMRFSPNPVLHATYDLAPNTPDSMYTRPDPVNPTSSDCGNSGAGWIGKNVPLPDGTSDIVLHAYGSTNMPGTNIVVGFHIWDNMIASGAPGGDAWRVSQTVNQRGWGSTTLGFAAQDGHQYGWNAWTHDGLLDSPATAYCFFNVDLTEPNLATIPPSPVFPPLGSGIKPTGHAGDTGATVRVTSTDPVPGGCTRGSCIASGVREFQYSLDDNSQPGGYGTVPASYAADGTAYADIPIVLNPDAWGSHRLYVRSSDWAGNAQSQAATYDFYAPWNPATKVVAGDLTFDGIPDYLLPSTDGTLALLPGNADFTAHYGIASTAERSPLRDSWNNYLLAHRGSISENSVDDLIAYNKGTKQLFAYINDSNHVPQGAAGHFTQLSLQVGTSGTLCPRGIGGTWDNITQMTAFAPTPAVKGRPNLVTIENGHLRYYPATPLVNCYFDEGIELGAAGQDWSGFTLLSPGLVNGTTALWVRDTVTGAVTTLPLPLGGNGRPAAGSLAAPERRTLLSAVADAAGKRMCADIDHGWTGNGTGAVLWNCPDQGLSPNQAFTFGTDGSLHVLGKCLDVTGGAAENGSWVNLWDCNNSAAQHWVVGPYAGTLKNPSSDKCLAVPEGSNVPGTHLVIWECYDDPSQRWEAPAPRPVLPLGLGSAAYPSVDSPGDLNGDGNPDLITTGPDGTLTQYLGVAPAGDLPQFGTPRSLPPASPAGYNINSAYNPARCLDNYGASNGGNLGFHDCWNGASQRFTFASDGTLRTGGRCVTPRDNKVAWGTQITIVDCAGASGPQGNPGTSGQVWTLRADGSLYNPAANACLELPGWNDANGTVPGLWQCNGNANQRWTYYPNTA